MGEFFAQLLIVGLILWGVIASEQKKKRRQQANQKPADGAPRGQQAAKAPQRRQNAQAAGTPRAVLPPRPVQTVRQWYQVLEDTLLGYQVAPFTKTTKRKAIATAKFYFFDIAIARSLCNIPAPHEGTTEYGEYFEQLVCMELKTWIDYTRPHSKLTYWRSTSNMEVDFCVDEELAIEVKSTMNITEKHLKGLRALREEGIFQRYIIVCQEEHPRLFDGIEILPWKYFFEQLWK